MNRHNDTVDEDRLESLAKKAEKLPYTFNMTRWSQMVPHDKKHPCGTVGCIAGNAVVQAVAEGHPDYKDFDFGNNLCLAHRGRELLGLSIWQANALFYLSSWPPYYRDKYYKARVARQRGKVIALRIRRFINERV